MDARGWVLLALVVVMVVVVVVAVLIRSRVQRAMYPGIDVTGWRRTSVTLPWRDRWELYRANATGRATTPRLAALAVQRGRWAEQTSAQTLRKGSAPRRLMLGVGIALTAVGALGLVTAIVSIRYQDAPTWTLVNGGQLLLGPLWIWAATGRPQRHYVSMFRRSVEANGALLAQHPHHDPDVSPR